MKGLKNFAVTFAVAAVVIGLIAVLISNYVSGVLLSVFETRSDELADILTSSADAGENADGEPLGENILKDIKEESFTLLLVFTDYRPDVWDDYLDSTTDDKVGYLQNGFRLIGAKSICLVRCSKETGAYVFIPIPPNTNVYTTTGYDTLYNIYGSFGFDYFKSKIESITGLGIDAYAVVDCNDLDYIVDTLGAVFASVPCDIFSDGVNFVSTTGVTLARAKDPGVSYTRFLEKCDDYIGPSSKGLLLFKDYSDGLEDELIISESYAKGILTNYTNLTPNGRKSMWSNLDGCFAETNINDDFFDLHEELLSAYYVESAIRVDIPGMFKPMSNQDASTFEIDVAKCVDAFSKYR